MLHGRGFATATTSAAFFPHCEQRNRGANSMSVVAQATRRARASGSISREAPQTQLTRIHAVPAGARNWIACRRRRRFRVQ
jgi:hypothetical protein